MNSLENQKICVVGGGLAGIAAAVFAEKQGAEVTLIESGPEIGGLLKSHYREGMGSFDYGTHLLGKTGIEEVDAVFFDWLEDDPEWIQHACCSAGIFFQDVLSRSGFVDTRSLKNDLYEKGIEEFLELEEEYDFPNLLEATEKTFGKTFSENIFAPVLGKFFGVELKELSANAHRLLGVSRIVGFTEEESIQLKGNSPWNDHRLAFHNPQVGSRGGGAFYPRSAGIGSWVESVKETLLKDKVTMMLSTTVSEVAFGDGSNPHNVTLEGGTSIAFDKLVWTVPPVFLLKAASVPLQDTVAPKFTKTILFDLVISEATRSDVFYVNCLDPSMDAFRVTLYDAMQGQAGKTPSRVTVEVIVPPEKDDSEITADSILAEMKAMKIVGESAELVRAESSEISFGFPIPGTEFISNQEEICKQAKQLSPDVALLGRAGGNTFFMRDVLHEVFDHFSS
ncbi:MAG: FAD-dependent oxidoreductase [Verrucomicrobiota bacterium]